MLCAWRFFMNYTTYDAAFKMKICEEYAAGHVSYRQLAKKYNVNLSSLVSWVKKYKAANNIVPLPKDGSFYKVAPRELSRELGVGSEKQSIPFRINGIDISTNAEGIMAILEAILK